MWFQLLSTCSLKSRHVCVFHLHSIFFQWVICTARYVLNSLKIRFGGTKFEIFCEQVGYLPPGQDV